MQQKDSITHEADGVDHHESVRQAAQKMAGWDTVTLPVFKDGEPVGVVTDRNITIRVVAEGLNPDRTPVGSIMTADPLAVPRPWTLGP